MSMSLLLSFFSGFFLKNTLTSNKSDIYQTGQLDKSFRPNFIDEMILMTNTIPRQTLILSGIRSLNESGVIYYTFKSFYFDGNRWHKQVDKGTSDDFEKIPTTPVREWNVVDDPSYMLRQSVSGKILMGSKEITFNVPEIQNEMSIRSNYKYTRFLSETNGKMVINNQELNVKVLYARIYSFSKPESLIFTDDPSGIQTEWLAFWDKDNNFYSIDETVIDNKVTHNSYKAHSLGLIKNNSGGIFKTFELTLDGLGRQEYEVKLHNLETRLSIQKINSVNKAENDIDIWNTGIAEGYIIDKNGQKIDGYGIYETISQ